MASLNKDQKAVLPLLRNWYFGNDAYFVLDGRGGCGKTYLVDALLKELNVKTLLLAPTHQAKKQLLHATKGIYETRTVDSALGIHPTTTEKTLKFQHVKLPDIWNNFQLAVVDEASQISSWKLNLLLSTGIKILFIGHKSQLPPVEESRQKHDLCLSPVFEQKFPSATLTIPQRNVGLGWDFCNRLENLIYSKAPLEIPKDFIISSKETFDYVRSTKGIEDFLSSQLKVICWSNLEVDKVNSKIRRHIFKEEATKPFCPEDKLILINPLTTVEKLEKLNDRSLIKEAGKVESEEFYSNTALEVICYKEVTIRLNPHLVVSAYAVLVEETHDKKILVIYVLKDSSSFQIIADFYERKAWAQSTNKEKEKAYRERWTILSCFAQVKFFYAATAYRMQGATIPKVIVNDKDIRRNRCYAEMAKTRYVAASRHKEELYYLEDIF